MNTKIAVPIVLTVVLAAAAFIYVRNDSSGTSSGAQEFVLRIEGKRIVEGAALLRVDEGDTVTIKMTSDEAEEFHLHGYDRSVDLIPGEQVSLTFVADASGRFPFELERSKTELGAIEVMP